MKTRTLIVACTLLAGSEANAEVTAAQGMVVTTSGSGAAAAGVEALKKVARPWMPP